MIAQRFSQQCTKSSGPLTLTPQDGYMPASVSCGSCGHTPHQSTPCETCRLIARVTRIEKRFGVDDGNTPYSDVLRPLPQDMPGPMLPPT